jgi:hypothetical protein
MDEALLDAYRGSAYRVRLPQGGVAVIRVDQPLPPALHAQAGTREWGFLTAWNPRSRPQPASVNRAAQRSLLHDLRSDPALAVHIAIGVGSDGWREPSFWIVGIDHARLQTLAGRYRQLAWLQGHGTGPARLCVLR